MDESSGCEIFVLLVFRGLAEILTRSGTYSSLWFSQRSEKIIETLWGLFFGSRVFSIFFDPDFGDQGGLLVIEYIF
ncbi:hypothetical protein AKJ40_03700 [candidate division MSBL1 archaeon SCGC-AAA259M10]|uniref:Uncharacterized protein n=3 Tax=candidate division MSBL1 TaxID=215777 RepID=A0A133U7J9_9EURY|nr:hypothetical protein AKJ62_01460 [candidate division MSBL1 archaeon SCGC-AAA259D14]KXA93724.1 hypothetical protein AKJ66_01260 [candidate division MSBL1 archaeon SCGC-AAA259E22]KXA99208.1 hypothetical protein AKJ40_03700 [candidate division MSBL1 archaeon SCGC-AAA259M10]